MKKMTLVLLALVPSLFLLGQNAQQKEAEVRAMELAEVQALLQKDIPALQKIWSPGFMVNAPLNAVFIGGQVELVQAGILSYTSFVRTIEQVMVLKDVVITMGAETVVPSGADPMAGQTVQRRYTNIWTKEKGEWVLVARQASNICPAAGPGAVAGRESTGAFLPGLFLKVRENPSPHLFHLDFTLPVEGRMTIQVLDSQGRIMETKQVEERAKTVMLGVRYPAGVYFAQITNGFYKKTVKLVKL